MRQNIRKTDRVGVKEGGHGPLLRALSMGMLGAAVAVVTWVTVVNQRRAKSAKPGAGRWPGKWRGCGVTRVPLPPPPARPHRHGHTGDSTHSNTSMGGHKHPQQHPSHQRQEQHAGRQHACSRGATSRTGGEAPMTAVLLPWADAAACEEAAAGLMPGLLPGLGSQAGEGESGADADREGEAGAQGAGAQVAACTASGPESPGAAAPLAARDAPCSEPAAQGGEELDGGWEAGWEALPVLGLDAEWEPETRTHPHNRVSVLQLCGAHGRVLLLRPDLLCSHARARNHPHPNTPAHTPHHHHPNGPQATTVHAQCSAHNSGLQQAVSSGSGGAAAVVGARPLPPSLVRALEDPGVVKAGVGIRNDCTRLARDFGIVVRGTVDLRVVARAVAPDALVAQTNGAGSGLAGLATALLGRTVDKAQQCSHWGREALSTAQVAYAAADAWVSRELLLELFRRHLAAAGGGREGCGAEEVEGKAAGVGAGGCNGAVGGECDEVGGDGGAVMGARARSLLVEKFQAFVAPFLDQALHKPKGGKVRRVVQQVDPEAALGGRGGAGDAAGDGGGGGGGEQFSAQIRKPVRHALRKKQLYENCRLLAPDGAVLCTCSTKKVVWYLDRGLATLESEEPLTVRLRFEPRGRGNVDDAYYTSDKENRCVVCGVTTPDHLQEEGVEAGVGGDVAPGTIPAATPATAAAVAAAGPDAEEGAGSTASAVPSPSAHDLGAEGAASATKTQGVEGPEQPPKSEAYLRHSIVPHCYRKCFPLSFKSHLSHDIVLMCLHCHQECSVHDQARMAALGARYDAPLSADTHKFRHDQDVAAVRSAARALTNPKVTLPAARRAELLRVVAAHFGDPDAPVSDHQLAQAGDLDPRKPAQEWVPHAERVVRALGPGLETIQEFVVGWRQHFLDKMHPKFLPPYWSVHSRVANSTAHVIADCDAGLSATGDPTTEQMEDLSMQAHAELAPAQM